MSKKYQDRAMGNTTSREVADAEGTPYFFPKANPPRTVVATSREEAEALLESEKEA